MRRAVLALLWVLIAAPVWAQTAYQYTFTHDRLNTTYYQTCVDSQACLNVGLPATNTVSFLLTNGTHTIKVQACNANGCVPLTTATGNPITVTVPPVEVETESVKVDQGSLSEFRYWIT